MNVNVRTLLERTLACCERIPKREVSPNALDAYLAEFERMLASGNLDPLRPEISRGGFYFSRAAFHTGARISLINLFWACYDAAEREDADLALDYARRLHRMLVLVEKALALEPPCEPGVLPFENGPSRWKPSKTEETEEGEESGGGSGGKKDVLAVLHKRGGDWTRELWDGVPTDWKYRAALAVCLIAPIRPEELTEGLRNNVHRVGVRLSVRDNELAIEYTPAKSHRGRYGTGRSTITVDWIIVGGPAQYLADLCAGGCSVVTIASTDAFRKALGRLGERVLRDAVSITPYVVRNQVVADLKATYGAGREVAIAAGHGTDKTQSHYGHHQHGRKLVGYVRIEAAREPRTGSIDRARQLANRRKLKTKSDR
ncbi:hypothetical protein IVB15_09295 [Bradyrhizobium sp. 182]|uniref:hypothetical protein n=1 Tax=unclassified Bradyrhizobium TaxID=2631580 RepID=UPI001FF7310F|nr:MULTISPECIES: hypothetical protein [unclassified Bradyrhizobium]MCK1422420.1 hypothetical protein [Bradyrhizobium sp. CW12]MCK1527933.1 hypothetical protein [Bradyrhizobium sp. 182]MCK1649034.1 hypothetical protein [Bradyrhizobium sp. 154]